MKFMLVMTLCSATFKTCLPPSNITPVYESYYDCATAGYLNAMGMMREIGVKETDRQRIVISFQCKEIPTAGVRHHRYNQ